MKNNRFGKAASLTTDQMATLLANAPAPRYRFLWTLQRDTAGRIGETLALTWADVRGTHINFRKHTTKTKTTRQVPMSDRVVEALELYRNQWLEEHGRDPMDHECLFHGRFNTVEPMTRQAADLALRKTTKAIGLEGVSLHSFRRTAAVDAAAKGISVHKIRGLTGHASLDGLSHYLSITDADVLSCIQ